jgi:hypothetical protein
MADYDFVYADDEGLKEQLSDFYNYQDLPFASLPLLRERFKEFHDSRETLLKARLSDLALTSSERSETLAMLLSWSLGNAEQSEESLLSTSIHLAAIMKSNQTLNAIGGLSPIYASFVATFQELEDWMAMNQEYSQLHHRGHHHQQPPQSHAELNAIIERLERTSVVQSALMAQSLLFNLIICNAHKEDFRDKAGMLLSSLK